MQRFVHLPEGIVITSCDVLVVRVGDASFFERECAGMHDEDSDSKSEQIDDLALVRDIHVYLRCHVAWRPHETGPFKAAARWALDWAGEAEVGELQVEVFVQKDVFRLKVFMRHSLAVNVVNGLDELLGVVTSEFLIQGACSLQDVKHWASGGKLAHDGANFRLQAVGLVPSWPFDEGWDL